ncbi:hypothetical protein BD779DRAFT_292644 [Infundibulicybe gibba]|nr:hypothetical protein BD779DRAFT_292644 [Infundibulicybe gibba]
MCPPSLAAVLHAFDNLWYGCPSSARTLTDTTPASTSSFAPSPTDVALAPNHHRHALAMPPHPQLVARRAESPMPPPSRLCSQLKRPATRGLCHRHQPPAPVLPQLTQALGASGRATTPDFDTKIARKRAAAIPGMSPHRSSANTSP